MNILIIDTSSSEEVKVGLKINGKEYFITSTTNKLKSQAVLPLIDKILRKHKLIIKDIASIQVNRGPGSFTGLKVGVVIANTLSLVLQIPVNGKKVGELEVPDY